ncbi:MAG TPA: FG-GAP-like repeat-containing protein, partial [Pirellulales bacterium]
SRPLRVFAGLLAWTSGAGWLGDAAQAADPLAFRTQEIATDLGVGYAVKLVDMNADKQLDVLVVDTNRVIWYENPSWKVHTVIKDQTELDNVCIDAMDIDGDGRLDLALGAHWKPSDTVNSGSLQWLEPGKNADDLWTVHPIDREPTIHRLRFIDLEGDGKSELIVVPLQGPGTKAPEWTQAGVRILSYSIPADPRKDRWRRTVLNEEMHVCHNFIGTDLNDDKRLDLVVTSFEGVNLLERGENNLWKRTLIGTGNQATRPNRGASEIKRGFLSPTSDYLATIEPWHGTQVVVYHRPKSGEPLWQRQVVDEDLKWGHAVWCVDLDGDQTQELVIGVRDTKSDSAPCGVRIYKADPSDPTAWKAQRIDPAGVAVEDLACADLNGDGKPEIVAVGRATKNVRIYWNEAAK